MAALCLSNYDLRVELDLLEFRSLLKRERIVVLVFDVGELERLVAHALAGP